MTQLRTLMWTSSILLANIATAMGQPVRIQLWLIQLLTIAAVLRHQIHTMVSAAWACPVELKTTSAVATLNPTLDAL